MHNHSLPGTDSLKYDNRVYNMNQPNDFLPHQYKNQHSGSRNTKLVQKTPTRDVRQVSSLPKLIIRPANLP